MDAASIIACTSAFACIAVLWLYNRYFKRSPSKSGLLPQTSFADKTITESAPVETPQRSRKSQLDNDKELYHQLHNLENYPEALPVAHTRLLSLFSETITAAQQPNAQSILQAVPEYDRTKITAFLAQAHDETCRKYEDYLARRKAGGAREMLTDHATALWWLKNSAPVKYVDGAWISHTHKITEGIKDRPSSAIAWQVMSEELGDGTLEKNHVYVYEELMKNLGIELPAAYDKNFIDPSLNLEESRCWKAAMAQLTVSLFPDQFMPESLGFNMSYETLPLHLLVSIHEMKELKLDPYYFVLHVAIDNSHSGHAAMALEAVLNYVESHPMEERQQVWRRVMAGFILAEGLPTTPDLDNYRQQAQLSALMHEKAKVSHQLHANSKVKVSGQNIASWLHPSNFTTGVVNHDFLRQLANTYPWIVKGSPEKSLLVKEISWGGRMFGAFSCSERKLLEDWIKKLGNHTVLPASSDAYISFTQLSPQYFATPSAKPVSTLADILHRPAASRAKPTRFDLDQVLSRQPSDFTHTFDNAPPKDIRRILGLYFVSLGLLEQTICFPSRLSNPVGMHIVQALRAMHGFSEDAEALDEAVSGMDEVTDIHPSFCDIGLQICQLHSIPAMTSISDITSWSLQEEDQRILAALLKMSFHHVTYRSQLLGMTLAIAQTLHSSSFLSSCGIPEATATYADILRRREQKALRSAIDHLDSREQSNAAAGFEGICQVFEKMVQ